MIARSLSMPLLFTLAGLLLAGQPAAAQQSYYGPAAGSQPHEPRPAEARDPVAPLRLTPRSQGEARKANRPAAPTPQGAVGTVVGSLAIVLGLFVVLAWCSRRFAPPGSVQLPKEALELLGRSTLNARQQVQLVRVGNKLLLLAITSTGTEPLTEITDAAEVERLSGLCRRDQPASATTSFTHVLGQLAREPGEGGFAGASRRGSRGAA
jgi:flagellar biogenesis protein FliO